MGNNDKGKGNVTAHATMMYGNGGIAPLINPYPAKPEYSRSST